MRLSDLKINQYAFILSVKILDLKSRRRILEMGFTPGTVIKLCRIAPCKDPICVSIRGYELCILRSIAEYIFVEVI